MRSFASPPSGKAYFRIVGPVHSTITQFNTLSGDLSWSNAVGGVTSQIQRAESLVAGGDWVNHVQWLAATQLATNKIIDLYPPDRMTFVPGGFFSMGDKIGDGWIDEVPVHVVHTDGFYIDRQETTKARWDQVLEWAIATGFTFDHVGFGKVVDHPVHTVNWWDVVKWCNARSEMEGLEPAYYTSSVKTAANIYRTGQVDVQNEWVRWDAGYRLPTEAEWEKAARAGLDGRFAWGNTIDHDHANYYANGSDYEHDASSYETNTYHPAYVTGLIPYTSPPESFPANGYGVFDTAGNLSEWCWDWYGGDYYGTSPSFDPRGPVSGAYRISRGGAWNNTAFECRISFRSLFPQSEANDHLGFRTVLPRGP